MNEETLRKQAKGEAKQKLKYNNFVVSMGSKRTDHPLVVDVAEVFDVSVLSGQSAAGHRSHIVRMRVALNQLVPHVVSVVRVEAPFQKLETESIFDNSGAERISNTDPLLFSVLARCGLVPVPRHEVTIERMAHIDGANNNHPHSEGTVTVDGVLLEISVHLVRNYIQKAVLGLP